MKRAENGQDAFVDRLLSRPELSAEAAPYWSALLYLERDRDISIGMSAMILLRIKRPVIRKEGRRRGYSGEALADFVEIVSGIDDERVRLANERSAQAAKASAEKAQKPKKR